MRDLIEIGEKDEESKERGRGKGSRSGTSGKLLPDRKKMSAKEREAAIADMTAEMKAAAKALEFEKAAWLRDEIAKLRG